MVLVNSSSLKVDSQYNSVGMVWGLAATWRLVCIHQMQHDTVINITCGTSSHALLLSWLFITAEWVIISSNSFLPVITLPPVGGQSIAITMPVSAVCMLTCLKNHMTRISVYCYQWTEWSWLCPSLTVNGAICYVHPVLWITSCFHNGANGPPLWKHEVIHKTAARIKNDMDVPSSSPGGATGGKVAVYNCRPVITLQVILV